MTEVDLIAALTPVARAFEALGVRYFLGGSVASSAHGMARASLDADVIAELEPSHVERVARQLAGAYYVLIDQMRAAATERRSFNLIHLATMFKIDVFVSKGRPFDRSAADRAQPWAIGDDTDSRFFVASAEDTMSWAYSRSPRPTSITFTDGQLRWASAICSNGPWWMRAANGPSAAPSL